MNQSIPNNFEQSRNEIRTQLESLLNKIDNDYVVTNAEELRNVELEISAATDQIAGTITKIIVTNSIQNTKVVEESKKIVKSSSDRMKNHGKRDVLIHPYRGDPFSIKATYYYRAGLSPQKRVKKGVFTLN